MEAVPATRLLSWADDRQRLRGALLRPSAGDDTVRVDEGQRDDGPTTAPLVSIPLRARASEHARPARRPAGSGAGALLDRGAASLHRLSLLRARGQAFAG